MRGNNNLTVLSGDIEGLHCAACVAFAVKEIESVLGVQSAEVSLVQKSFKINLETDIDYTRVEKIKQTVEEKMREASYEIRWSSDASECGTGFAWQIADIEGLHCSACVNYVDELLRNIDGVKELVVSLLHHRISVKLEPTKEEVLKKEIENVLTDVGYKIKWLNAKDINQAFDGFKRNRERMFSGRNNWLLVKMVLAVVLAILMMLIHLGVFNFLHSFSLFGFVFSSIAYWFCAFDYHKRALKMLRLRHTNMDTLISLSTSVAYFYSSYAFFFNMFGKGQTFVHTYFDAVCMIVAFVLLGKFLEENAKRKTTLSYQSLLSQMPKTAMVKRNGKYIEVPHSDLVLGDRILIRKGENVAVDGVVTQGTGSVNEANINGESIPIQKQEGDSVYASTTLVSGTFEYEANAIGYDTVYGKILEIIQDAQSQIPPIQRLADKVAAVFVPVILLISISTFLFWSFLASSANISQGLFFAISVLAIACPCAMGLATPTAITVAVGRAAKERLLVSDVVALEQVSSVTDIVFDKTGTLTSGVPQVVDTLWWGENDVFKTYILKAEQMSSHPLAQAVVKYLLNEISESVLSKVDSLQLYDYDERVGEGVQFKDEQGIVYKIGRLTFADAPTKVPMEKKFVRELQTQNPSASFIYVSRNNILIGMFAIVDEPKPDARDFIHKVKERGITVHLVSGDRKEVVEDIAKKLNIDYYSYVQMPQDKRSYIETVRLDKSGAKVMMIGDGLNDSPAMLAADFSVAMSTGSDVTNGVSQLSIIGTRLNPITKLLDLSAKTKKIIYENLFVAFAYNIVAVPLAAGLFYPRFFVSPQWAALIMAISSIIVVTNSLRMKSIQFA